MAYPPPAPAATAASGNDAAMTTHTPNSHTHPNPAASANTIYHPSPYPSHPPAPAHPPNPTPPAHAHAHHPSTALPTHPPPIQNHPSYRQKNAHLRGASYSSVSSSGTNVNAAHGRQPSQSQSHGWTPSLQAIQAGTPHIGSSPLASVGAMGGQGYQYSPTMHHQQSHPHAPAPALALAPAPLNTYAQPVQQYQPHQVTRAYHPNMPAAPTPLKQSVSDSFAISQGHAQPHLYQYAQAQPQSHLSVQAHGSPMVQPQHLQQPVEHVFGYNLTVNPPSNANSTQASPIMHHAQVDMSTSQPGQMSTPPHVQMYTSPSQPMPHPASYPTYPSATYQFPAGTMNAPAFEPSNTSSSAPFHYAEQHQARIVGIEDEAEAETGDAEADGDLEYEADISQLHPQVNDTVRHSRSRASSIYDTSDSGGSSYSLEQSSRAVRGGRGRGGRGGGRGRGTKRKAKGSGWTKRKPVKESAKIKRSKLGRPAGGVSAAYPAEPDPSIMSGQAFTSMPVPPTAVATPALPFQAQAEYTTQQGPLDTYNPTAFPADDTAPPPEIAILLKNVQPGPLILPPPGCGLQIANLLIHVPAELSESKEIQMASKRWAHVIDANGTPMMLDPIKPHVHEQYTCRCCRKTYTGKNARSVARRHLQDKHGVPLMLQERRSRWDRSTRPKDLAEAHEREKRSKRESAKRARENQRIARQKVAAFASGDTTVYTPASGSTSDAFTREPISHPRPSLRSSRLQKSTTTSHSSPAVGIEGSRLVPVSPEYSLNSDGSPVLAGTASARQNTPIEMVAPGAGSSAQHMQMHMHNGAWAPAQTLDSFDQRFEQTRQLLRKQGWSEANIGSYYQQLAGGWTGMPQGAATAEAQGSGAGSVEMSRSGHGYTHGQMQPATHQQNHGQASTGVKSSGKRRTHQRTGSAASSSNSSWVHVENETPDYAQLKGQQTWVVPPPSVSADTPFTRAPLQSMSQNMPIGHGAMSGPGYSIGNGMNLNMGSSAPIGLGVGMATEDDTEVAAAGLVDLSSPIKGQPVKKKARPTAMRRSNTVAVSNGDLLSGPAFAWAGQHLQGQTSAGVPHALTINTHAAASTIIDPAPLSAPASGSNPTFFPSAYTGTGPNYMLDSSAAPQYISESPLAYLSQNGQAGAAGGSGPSRVPRQPFARGRAQLARSISLSLPSTNSPIRLDDLDVFSQNMSRTNSLGGADGGVDGQEGRESKRAKRTSQHGRTKSSELLQPISERIQPLSEDEGSASTRAVEAKATGLGGVMVTATGSPVTRGRKARADTSGLVLGRKAGVRLALGSVSVDLGKAGQENVNSRSVFNGTTGLARSPLKSSFLAQSAPEQTHSLGSTVQLGASAASATGSPMFKLAASAFKTPLKQRDANANGNGNASANLAPTLSDLNTPARLELEYYTPAPFSRFQSGTANKPKNDSAHPHTRPLGFEPYSTSNSNSSSTKPDGSSMLTSLAPTPQSLGLSITPRRPATAAANAGSKYPQSVTRNWAGLSSPAHAGLAHQLGLGIGDSAADWQTPRVLRELNGQITRGGGLETPGMADADADWDDEGM